MNDRTHDAADRTCRLAADVAKACARIAPTWPLDRFIAVNPYWGWRDVPLAEAAARLSVLSGTRLTMPRAWFREQWQAGRLDEAAIARAIERTHETLTVGEVLQAMHTPAACRRLPLVTDWRDAREPRDIEPWRDVVKAQVSQHCAACFDDGQARWHFAPEGGLYGMWRAQLAADRAVPWSTRRAVMRERVLALPQEPLAAIDDALAALSVPGEARPAYLTALLLDVNGWAAWCAYRRWQARLDGADDEAIVELLAVRATWDWLLAADASSLPGANWKAQWCGFEARVAEALEAQRADWILQHALELGHQQPLCDALAAAPRRALPRSRPDVQAVFCIDVRSEVFRRALEGADATVATRGFAGFFGLPIAYAPAGSALVRPQVPGLIAPREIVTECVEARKNDGLARRRQAVLSRHARWQALRTAAASAFSFVEACGLGYGIKLLRATRPSTARRACWEDTGLPRAAQRAQPRLALVDSDPGAAAELAHGILTAMGLTANHAPLVLLAAHASSSANNPHAAALDCGACGGQSGEVNARAAAHLLNAPAVREALRARGLSIPETTHFLAGLHDTTTDDFMLYDLDEVPATHHARVERLREVLREAGVRARAARAASLGLAPLAGAPQALAAELRRRANDWSEVRPEWGLAGNWALIVAPRRLTEGLDLEGRCFLHDYDWREDESGALLELVMTAPMVVANWINLQYYASTVDNARYGSGNKVLHNVVGARVGVFEGNGGDLRIGLPLQSLHDGRALRHTPLRLSVFVEAPREKIEAVLRKHAVVRELVAHGWLHLFRVDPATSGVERRAGGSWSRASATPRVDAGAGQSELQCGTPCELTTKE